jgi:hypothetical protein
MEVAACVENFTFQKFFPLLSNLDMLCAREKLALASTFLFAKSIMNFLYIKNCAFHYLSR